MHSEFSNVRPKGCAASGPLLSQKGLRRVFQCLTKILVARFPMLGLQDLRRVFQRYSNVRPARFAAGFPMLG